MLHAALLLTVSLLAVRAHASSTPDSLFVQLATSTRTDKVGHHEYQHMYHTFLHGQRLRPTKLLEIGLGCNMNSGRASIDLWQAYYPVLDLWMADIDPECAAKVQNATSNTILIGDQSSEADLMRWVDTSGGAFDVIADDGSHQPAHQMESFRVLFQHALKPGGIYFVEDIETPVEKKLCDSSFDTATWSRDRFAYWAYELMKSPRGAKPDTPPGLAMVACQREACAFFKCHDGDKACP